MADFFQNGKVMTFHNLSDRPLEQLERELRGFARRRPMALVLPSLYSELEGAALAGILTELQGADYLDEIVIGLDQADDAQYRHALGTFGRLPQRHRVLWHDGPRLRTIDAMLASRDLAPRFSGKGRNVWYCFGYLLATGRAKAVALHDCDITNYRRDLLARLLYPVANPDFDYHFCKGYYARVADGQLNGRVCRLLVSPLIRALRKLCGPCGLLEFLDSFRYPLSGECALAADVLRDIRMPCDWGLEVGLIAEVWSKHPARAICQSEIADRYDHKHQDLSAEDATRGLSKMSVDIARSLYRRLAAQGHVFGEGFFQTLQATYSHTALELIESYQDDARMNGLRYDRHAEEEAVAVFARNLAAAGEGFHEQPVGHAFMPAWERVIREMPGILEELLFAVEEDGKEVLR